MNRPHYFRRSDMTLKEKLLHLSWSYVFFIFCIAAVGIVMLYSAANGSWDPWASRQAIRFVAGFMGLLFVALVDIRIWMRYAYFFYFGALILLIAVEVRGQTGMGAKRWIDMGFFILQPSELMKITLILALARFFHGSSFEDIQRTTYLFRPLLLMGVPAALVLKQPDLGTALMLLMVGASMFFLVGVQMWKFGLLTGLGLASIPIGWQFLHTYQKKRVLTFLNPENDPLGAGYHIMQSKITLGSGGLFGKGFLQGSQSHLNFLPEKQTDFIFTMLAEEFGMIGGVTLLLLYLILIAYGYIIALRCTNYFGRLMAVGVTTNLFLYVFINIAMVMGLIPVVGVPLPLISYGGTVMLTLMAGFGLVLCAHIHKDVQISRRGASDDLV